VSRHSIAPWLAVALAKAGCAKCNLQNGADGISDIEGKVARGSDEGVWKRASFKSDKILTIAPWIFVGAATAPHIQKLSG